MDIKTRAMIKTFMILCGMALIIAVTQLILHFFSGTQLIWFTGIIMVIALVYMMYSLVLTALQFDEAAKNLSDTLKSKT